MQISGIHFYMYMLNSALEEYWVARLGALRRGTNLPSPYEQLRPVSRILLHPGYVDAGFINDISLLQMKESVTSVSYTHLDVYKRQILGTDGPP